MNVLIFMAGGSGTRFGSDIPKQYVEADGEPIFLYTLRKYLDCEAVDKVVIVANSEWLKYTEDEAKRVLGEKLLAVIPGGRTRSHSVKNGLTYCSHILGETDYVLIHDATNPFVDLGAIDRGIEAAAKTGAAVIGTRQLHTIYSIDKDSAIRDFIPRDGVSSGYSPEIFRFALIYPCYEQASDEQLERMTSTVALALQYGTHVRLVPASLINIKITYPDDLKAFIAIKRFEECEGAPR